VNETLFISDLHLDPGRPAASAIFFALLRSPRAARADALYILGDLFEVWLGDDVPLPGKDAVAQAIGGLASAGTPVFLMHGNRDFFIGERFAAESGCTLVADPSVIDLYGERTLLMHGDTLCTDDLAYQAFRKQVRDPAWQRGFLTLPFEERIRLGQQVREESRTNTQAKAAEIMDANQQEVERVMREHGVEHLIHGHTHRAGVHEFELDGRTVRRSVLGDWHAAGSLLSCAPGSQRLEVLSSDGADPVLISGRR
jgi:UDP-2,3-diacylglucosamine hydrolase